MVGVILLNTVNAHFPNQENLTLSELQEVLDTQLETILTYIKDEPKKERVRRIRKLLNKYKTEINSPYVDFNVVVHLEKKVKFLFDDIIVHNKFTRININTEGEVTTANLPSHLGDASNEFSLKFNDNYDITTLIFISRFYGVLNKSFLELQKKLKAKIVRDANNIKSVDYKFSDYIIAEKI